jgi:hypothetical protein
LRRFFVRNDVEYETLIQQYQAKTLAARFFYLFMHLLPGILAYVLINIPSVHAAALRLTGLSDPIFQGTLPGRSRLRVARRCSADGAALGG